MSENDETQKIVDIDMKAAGEWSRRIIARQWYEAITRPSALYESLIKDLPKPTRWQRFKIRTRWKIEDFRIWLSKRIYDWSSYEDQ